MSWLDRFFEYRTEKLRMELEAKKCDSCDVLRQVIARQQDLIEKLTEKEEAVEVKHERSELKPIQPVSVPWSVRRQMLEKKDRDEALKNESKASSNAIKKLEDELGVPSAVPVP